MPVLLLFLIFVILNSNEWKHIVKNVKFSLMKTMKTYKYIQATTLNIYVIEQASSIKDFMIMAYYKLRTAKRISIT